MLNLSLLQISISKMLNPLRLTLENEASITFLPKEPQKYSSAQEMGSIKVLVPQIRGSVAVMDGVQTLDYTIVIAIALGKLYQDDLSEKAVVEWVADEIYKSLFGLNPFEEKETMQRSLWLQSYDLFRPEGGQWEAEIAFSCSKQVKASDIPRLDDTIYDELRIGLFSVLNQSDPNPVLLSEIIFENQNE